MKARGYLRLGLVLTWASVLTIPVGVHRMLTSPQLLREMKQEAARHTEGEMGRAIFALMALTPMSGCFAVSVAAVFTGAAFALPRLSRVNRGAWLVLGTFSAIGAIDLIALGFYVAVDALLDGALILGLACFVWAIGLTSGAVGVLGMSR